MGTTSRMTGPYKMCTLMLRRSIHENSRLADIVEAVQRLELAMLADTGLAGLCMFYALHVM